MKKNNLFTLAFAACALLLSACSTELDTSDNPLRVGTDEVLIAVSLQFPKGDAPVGYAPGEQGDEVLPGVALPIEKEIKSIAFIAFTKGGTSIYLSKNPTLSDNGFTEPLTPKNEAVPGEYTAKFKIKSGDFDGKTTIVAVANYFEHGLTFDGNTLTLDGLKKMLSDELTTEADKNFIDYPLLMTMAYEGEITEGATVPIAFVMERIMARIDVVNNAFDKTTPANDFVLTSAQLISAPTQGTMIAGQTGVDPSGYIKLKVQDDVKEILPADGNAVSPTNPAKQQLAPMYVYENSNTDKDDATKLSATATHVLVKGTYKGMAYDKMIEFRTLEKVEAGVKVGGEIVPIARNTRYVVEISSGTEGKPEFDVTVTDWAEGDQLDVGIDFTAPVLEGLDQIIPGNGAVWEVIDNPDGTKTRTLNITNATAGMELNFKVRGFQDSDFTTTAEYDENTAPLAKAIQVERSEPALTGYADAPVDDKDEAPLVRTYKVTIPKYTEECPSLTKLIVYNAAYPDAKTEITVKYAPVFIGDIKSPGATINQATKLVDLKNVPNDQTGEISFFASANTAFETTVVNKLSDNFYFVTNPGVDESDQAITEKYGPGKRVTLSYRALSDHAEWAEVSVKETGAEEAIAKRLFVKCLKKALFASVTFSPNAANTLVEGTNKLYLAINNGDHGTLDYTVYDDASNTITLEPSYTNTVTLTNPDWAKNVSISENTVVETYADYQIVKRMVKVALPKEIKNPSAVTSFKPGISTPSSARVRMYPVYLAGTTITDADKAFAPVCVKGVWWAPINIGQTKISTINNPSTEGGNLFQWGRKQALTWASSTTVGPLAPTAPEVTQDKFITAAASPFDWRNPQENALWNSGTDVAPIKVVANDPCPAGWRVPSKDEWAKSIVGGGTPAHVYTAATSPSATQNGLLTVTGEGNAKLYFPAAGRLYYSGAVANQGSNGYYWASAWSGALASNVYFSSATVSASNDSGRVLGMPVRCVQDLLGELVSPP